MLHQVAGNGVDSVLGFQDVAGGAVLFLDRQQFVFAAVPEQVFEFGVECAFFIERAVRGFAFVQDLERGAVVHRIHQAVGVDVLAKALVRLFLAMALG